jgi:LysR family transcriptional activator of nhaA
MLNYNHLRYFWVVAREGRLTKAAEQLNLSQSALSAQIAKLEERLGHKLFERRGRGLMLTEAGRIALDHADAIFATGDELIGRLKHTGQSARAQLRVGALATLSRNFQLAFLRPILGDPSVEVAIRSGGLAELITALEEHQLDVVLVNQAPSRAAATPWTVHIVDDQHVSLIGAPNLVGGETDPRTLLATRPLIVPSADSGVRTSLDAMIEREGLAPAIIAQVDDMAMMRLLAREGQGLAVLPPIVVRDELISGHLVEACILPGIHEVFAAITPKRRFPNPLIARLLAWSNS